MGGGSFTAPAFVRSYRKTLFLVHPAPIVNAVPVFCFPSGGRQTWPFARRTGSPQMLSISYWQRQRNLFGSLKLRA